jgi:Fe-S-cluster containining protein
MSRKSARRPGGHTATRQRASRRPAARSLQGGLAALGLTPPPWRLLAGELAEAFTQAALKAQALARGGREARTVVQAFLAPLRQVYHVMHLVAQLVMHAETPDTPRVACGAGCYSCCRLYVEVSPFEAFAIAAVLSDLFAATQATQPDFEPALRACLAEAVARYAASGFSRDRQGLCAFLTRDGVCGIYPGRPSACRTYYSTSRAACQRYFSQPQLTGNHAVIRGPDHGLALALTGAEVLALARPPFPRGGPAHV